jgi:hypothetical protein
VPFASTVDGCDCCVKRLHVAFDAPRRRKVAAVSRPFAGYPGGIPARCRCELRGTGVTATVSCPGATATEFAAVAGNDRSRLFQRAVMGAPEVAAYA